MAVLIFSRYQHNLSVEVFMDIAVETDNILQFVKRGNYHAAYNIALSALNYRRKHQDQAGVDHFIVVIRGIVDALDDEFGSARQNKPE
jgi:hypothetical protein